MRRTAAALLMSLITVASCSEPSGKVTTELSPSPTPEATIGTRPVKKPCQWKVGVLGAFSGPYGGLGISIRESIEIGIKGLNSDPEIPCRIKLVSADSKGEPKRALSVARSLLRRHELIACLCGFFSGEVLAIGEILSDHEVFMASTGTDPIIRKYDFTTWHRVVPADDKHAVVAGSYIAEGLGARRVAVVSDHQRYSRTMADGVASALGDSVRIRLTVTPSTDWRDLVEKIKREKPDVVYYGGFTDRAAELKRWLGALRIEADFVTDNGAFDPTFDDSGSAVGAQLTCGCTTGVDEEGMDAFLALHEDLYSEDPGPMAAEMYDVTTFIGDALRAEDPLTTEQARRRIIKFFRSGEQRAGMVKNYRWDRGELVVEPDDVWVYEWDDTAGQLGDFVPIGTVEELTS